ncbi:MAG TPA: carbohydrate ABC transporter permease [Spirochaetia bacterium]|nr:carbohydrate ABC transporter permease [Spirochaetia bacterium]
MRFRARVHLRVPGIVLIWLVAILWSFPILYMFLTSLKGEADVLPPSLWVAHPTLENYATVLRQEIVRYILDSSVISVATVALCLVIGVPVAYAVVFGRLSNSDNLFFWFLSTTLFPPVAVIVPVFLIFRLAGLLDTVAGMILIYTGFNIPIVIWMTRSFLLDVPRELLESSDIDGSSRFASFFSVVLPLARQGIVSTGLLVFIFVWNEFFFSINLTYIHAAPVPVYMASYMTQEGLFWAKLCAISTLVVLPPMILGWFAQRSLVKGLTMGAVKG